jgi:hypothetical protein
MGRLSSCNPLAGSQSRSSASQAGSNSLTTPLNLRAAYCAICSTESFRLGQQARCRNFAAAATQIRTQDLGESLKIQILIQVLVHVGDDAMHAIGICIAASRMVHRAPAAVKVLPRSRRHGAGFLLWVKNQLRAAK